jgi:quercetin dioxygenase-like cupin family protein
MKKLLFAPLIALAINITSTTILKANDDGHGSKHLGVTIETLVKDSSQWDGKLLPSYPTTQPEITILRIIIPPKTILPMHIHPVINAAVIIKGKLEVILADGTSRLYKEGDGFVEVVNTAHYGKSHGNESVEILVFYAGTKQLNTTTLIE